MLVAWFRVGILPSSGRAGSLRAPDFLSERDQDELRASAIPGSVSVRHRSLFAIAARSNLKSIFGNIRPEPVHERLPPLKHDDEGGSSRLPIRSTELDSNWTIIFAEACTSLIL